MSEKTYRIESLQTTGWEIVEPLGKYENLTREQAKEMLVKKYNISEDNIVTHGYD